MTNVVQTIHLDDTLLVEESNNLELPEWTTKVYPEMLHAARVRAFNLFTETDYMKRIRGGPLITDIYQQMLQKQNGTLTRNFSIYSAHDSTISNVMRALNVDDKNASTPDYGATMAFELHCGRSKKCFVKVRHHID